MNMNTDELNSLNNSNSEHLDKTVNDATSKTEEDSNHNNNNPEESPENYGDSDQTEQTSIGR